MYLLLILIYRCDTLYGTPSMFLDALANPDLDKFDLSTLRKGIAAKTSDKCNLPSRRLQVIWAQERTWRAKGHSRREGACARRALRSRSQ